MKTLEFKEYTWDIKESSHAVGPGPNVFSSDISSVSSDEDGLHLSIRKEGDQWFCAEAVLNKPLGYGTYVFRVATPLSPFEKQAVFSGFLYQDDEHEIDMEVSPVMIGKNRGQHIIQPGTVRGNLSTFKLPTDEPTSHSINWTPEGVNFKMWNGDSSYAEAQPLAAWSYPSPAITSPDKARFIFNLWLYKGKEPRQAQSVTISDFTFYPYVGS